MVELLPDNVVRFKKINALIFAVYYELNYNLSNRIMGANIMKLCTKYSDARNIIIYDSETESLYHSGYQI